MSVSLPETTLIEWVRLNYASTHHHPPLPTTTHNHPPPSTTSQNIPTTTNHHSPPSTTTHHQLKHIHRHPLPAKNISNTTHRQTKYIHHQPQSKIYRSKKVFYQKNVKIFYAKVNDEKHFD